jgi:hypothetical protein
MRRYIFFQPNQYALSSAVHYWPTNPEVQLIASIKANTPVNLTGSMVAEATLSSDVRSSPWVVLFGGCIGGILSYLLLWLAGGRGTVGDARGLPSRIVGRVAGISSAAILAGVITILLQRVGSTPFLVTVTVNDFWGAIVIGFLAQYVGVRVLDRFVDSERKRTSSTSGAGISHSGESSEAPLQDPNQAQSLTPPRQGPSNPTPGRTSDDGRHEDPEATRAHSVSDRREKLGSGA